MENEWSESRLSKFGVWFRVNLKTGNAVVCPAPGNGKQTEISTQMTDEARQSLEALEKITGVSL